MSASTLARATHLDERLDSPARAPAEERRRMDQPEPTCPRQRSPEQLTSMKADMDRIGKVVNDAGKRSE
jgi:hypothetical protein